MGSLLKSGRNGVGDGDDRRVFGLALAILSAPVLIAPLLAPHIFNLLIGLGRRLPSLSFLRGIEFDSLLSRTMLILAVASLWPVLSLLDRNSLRVVSHGGVRRGVASLGKGVAIGFSSMIAVPIIGLALGAYSLQSDFVLIDFFAHIIVFLAVGLLVGTIEEYLFRGVIFGLIERASGLWAGLLLSAAIYSLVHFINPVLPTGVVYGHWYSGFQALAVAARSFAQMGVHVFPYSLTLFLIGVSLALIYHHSRDLMLVAGIHAGWIVVLKICKDALSSTGALSRFFGDDMVLSKTYVIALVTLIFLAFVFIFYAVNRRGSSYNFVDINHRGH